MKKTHRLSKHIVLAVTNDLLTDQRVDRTCSALTEAGYAVTLVGRRLPQSAPLPERKYGTRRMRLLFKRSALFYAEYNLRLFLKLLCSQADAFFANDTDTLLACCCAARVRRKKLVFDAHELFPDVPELANSPSVRRVWKAIERHCIPHVDAAFTVCQSVADEYERRYGVKMSVVRNLGAVVPADGNAAVSLQEPGVRTLLYQGAVNIGRGVQELIDVMELLPDCRLCVAGDGDERERLCRYTAALPWSSRVVFLGRVAPADLRQLSRTADLGVCLLEDLGLNYRYSLPNRIADFAQAGVPILATDFPEIRRVVATYRIGTLAEPCPAVKEGVAYREYLMRLGETITRTLHDWAMLPEEEKHARFAQARQDLCWEKEKNIIIDKINAIF